MLRVVLPDSICFFCSIVGKEKFSEEWILERHRKASQGHRLFVSENAISLFLYLPVWNHPNMTHLLRYSSNAVGAGSTNFLIEFQGLQYLVSGLNFGQEMTKKRRRFKPYRGSASTTSRSAGVMNVAIWDESGTYMYGDMEWAASPQSAMDRRSWSSPLSVPL
jgi:hypothetical protein